MILQNTDGCATLPSTTPESLKCSCNHLTTFGGRWKAAPVAPNTVRVRLINEQGFLDNPVVFVPITVLWFLFALLLISSYKLGKRATEIPDVPYQLDREDELSGEKRPLNKYRLTVKTGTKPFAGLTRGNEVVVQLHCEDDEQEDVIRLDADASVYMARNTASVWLFSTPLALADVDEITLKVSGADNNWYVQYAMLSNLADAESAFGLLKDKHLDPFEMDQRSKFFWVNEWVGIYKEVVAASIPFEEFNSPANLFGYRLSESISDKHFLASMFLSPPKSKYTPAQRVMVCQLLLNGIVFVNAFFYKDSGDMVWGSAIYIGAISSLIVSAPVGLLVLAFRYAGTGGSCTKGFIRSLAWLGALGTASWCSYYVLLLSFDWGQGKSTQWLQSCGTSFALSTLVTDAVYVIIRASIAARLRVIHDVASVDEVALQNMAAKLAKQRHDPTAGSDSDSDGSTRSDSDADTSSNGGASGSGNDNGLGTHYQQPQQPQHYHPRQHGWAGNH